MGESWVHEQTYHENNVSFLAAKGDKIFGHIVNMYSQTLSKLKKVITTA